MDHPRRQGPCRRQHDWRPYRVTGCVPAAPITRLWGDNWLHARQRVELFTQDRAVIAHPNIRNIGIRGRLPPLRARAFYPGDEHRGLDAEGCAEAEEPVH